MKLWQLYLETPLPDSRIIGGIWDIMIILTPNIAKRFFPSLGRDFVVYKTGKEDIVLVGSDLSLCLRKNYARILLREYREWQRDYVMLEDLSGKTVLDIGSGCGEGLQMWFSRGASKVFAVEPDERCIPYIEKNAKANSWNVEIFNDIFRVRHLELQHDAIKIDCEGGELTLLDQRIKHLNPCRMELHPRVIGKENVQRIVEKFSLRRIRDDVNVYGHV